MKYFKKLIGENIYLSPLNEEDYEKNCLWMNDFKVTDGICLSSKLNGINSEKQWLQRENPKDEYNFGIITQKDDELIGNCSIAKIDFISRKATVGIFI